MAEKIEGGFIIKGPATMKVVEGNIRIIGGILKEGDTITIPVGRSYPGYTDSARVEVTPSRESLKATDSSEYWRMEEAAVQIANASNPVIVGPTDAGKSTLAAWAYNIASRSKDTFIMTTDVGQNELYCPGFVAKAKPEGVIAQPGGRYKVEASCLVGSFTPMGSESRYLLCSSKLSRGREWIVVDTDGWVTPWRGLELKAALVHAVRSNIIVAVGLDDKYARFLADVSGVEAIRLEGRKGEGGKSREERRRHRERLLAKHLVGGKSRSFKVDDTPVYGAPVFAGMPLEGIRDRGIVYAEVKPDGVVKVVRGHSRARGEIPLGWERGLLAGLTRGEMSYPGIVERVNYAKRTISIYTRHQGEVDYIEVGTARIDLAPYTGKV